MNRRSFFTGLCAAAPLIFLPKFENVKWKRTRDLFFLGYDAPLRFAEIGWGAEIVHYRLSQDGCLWVEDYREPFYGSDRQMATIGVDTSNGKLTLTGIVSKCEPVSVDPCFHL